MTGSGHHVFGLDNTTVAGHDSLQQLGALVAASGMKSPLAIVSTSVANAGIADIVLRSCGIGKDRLGVFQGIPAGSSSSLVGRIAQQYRSGGHDGLLAIGGNSVIDTAKAVGLLVSRGGEDVTAFVGLRAMEEPAVPLIAIPTAIGCVSGGNASAIIESSRTGRRLLFSSPCLAPYATVIDPQTTRSLQPLQIGAGALAVVALALDSATSLAANELGISFSERAIFLAFTWGLRATSSPFDAEARLQLALASQLAGMACALSRPGSVQAIANSLSAMCLIPYTLNLAILSPYTLSYHSHKSQSVLARLETFLRRSDAFAAGEAAVAVQGAGKTTLKELQKEQQEAAQALIERVKSFSDSLRQATQNALPNRLFDILAADGRKATGPSQFNSIAAMAQGDAAMFTAAEEMDMQDIVRVLESAYWGYPLDPATIRKGHQRTPLQETT